MDLWVFLVCGSAAAIFVLNTDVEKLTAPLFWWGLYDRTCWFGRKFNEHWFSCYFRDLPSTFITASRLRFDIRFVSYLSSDQLLVSLPPLPVRLFLFPIPFNISTLPETFSALLPSLRFSRKQHGMSSIWFFKHNIFFYQLQQICILCLMWQVYLSVRKGCRSLHENRSDHFQRG